MLSQKKHLQFRTLFQAIAWTIVLQLITVAVTAVVEAQEVRSTVSVQTTDGQRLAGELVTLHGQIVELKIDGGNRTLAFEQIESVDLTSTVSQASPASLQCRLADGSRFNATDITIADAQATFKLSCGATTTVAQSSLKSLLLFDLANEPEKLKQWDEFLLDFTATSDAIIAEKNSDLQAIEGIVGDANENGFDFQMGGRQVTVKAEKLTGLILYRADRELPSSVCEVRLTDNSTIAAAQIELAEGRLNIATGTGDQISLPLELIATLDLAAGRSIYLSDLLPTTNDWQPLVASQTHLEDLSKLNLSIANESFSGETLSLRTTPTDGLNFLATTQTYEKGFAMRGGCRMAFNLNGQFTRLTALAGFDPKTEALPGNVEMEIQVDNKTVLSTVMENRKLVQPLPIEVDLANAKRLIIRVNYHDGRSVGDLIHLVDARLAR